VTAGRRDRRGRPAAPSSPRLDDRAWERLRDLLEVVVFIVVVALIWVAIPLPVEPRQDGAAAARSAGPAPDALAALDLGVP
jgi:hypothetical protein